MQKKDKAKGLEMVKGKGKVPKESERGDIGRKCTFLLEDVQFVNEVSSGAWRMKDKNNVIWVER